MKCNIQWITSWDEALSSSTWEIWMDHYQSAEHSSVFMHPSMGFAWISVYRQVRNLQPLFCLADINNQSFFYPMVIWTKNFRNVYQRLVIPVGFSDFDYLEPLVKGKVAGFIQNSLLNEICKDLFCRFSVDSVELGGFRSETHFLSKHTLFSEEICPLLHISEFEDFEGFKQTLKSSLRGDLNRQQRRLSEKGELSLTVFDHNNRKTDSELCKMLELHRKHWPRAYKAPDFHRKMVESASNAGLLHFSALQLNGVSISWNIGFYEKKRFYYYMPVIDPDYQSYSPGKIHLLLLNKWAIEHQAEYFDHLRGSELYKANWIDSEVKLYKYKMYSKKPMSLIRNGVVDIIKRVAFIV